MKKKLRSTKTELSILNNNPNDFHTINHKQDTSPKVYQRSKFKGIISIFDRPLTENQNKFLSIADDKNTKIMFVSGPAGTAKTFLAIRHALKLIGVTKTKSDLIYIRSAVESADSKLGFLPGQADEKMEPYLQPLMDKLSELIPRSDIEALKNDQRFSSVPVGFLRGLNWNAKIIVSDESQNMTYKELLTLITRTGEFSQVLILGDPDQTDINGKSGFLKMLNVFDDEESRQNGVHVFRFTEEDIVRSGIVRFIIQKTKAESSLKK